MVNRRNAAAVVVSLLAAVSTAAVTSADAAGRPQPLPQAQAQALIAAPAAVQSGSTTRAISPQEALAAASIAGATVAIAPGLSLTQAVGFGLPVAPSSAVRPAASVGCSANAAWHEWGTWPYQQRITDTTYWCAVYGDHITYTSSSVTASGTLCGTGWTSSQLIGGGIGYSWFVMRSSAGWNCPTVIPWVTLHPSHHVDVSRNAWGSTAEVGSG